eukprot:Sspe_Gene.83832::Locus_55000_Transcript_2_2_Confidence_0.500_Length_969::g.83832::m.83832
MVRETLYQDLLRLDLHRYYDALHRRGVASIADLSRIPSAELTAIVPAVGARRKLLNASLTSRSAPPGDRASRLQLPPPLQRKGDSRFTRSQSCSFPSPRKASRRSSSSSRCEAPTTPRQTRMARSDTADFRDPTIVPRWASPRNNSSTHTVSSPPASILKKASYTPTVLTIEYHDGSSHTGTPSSSHEEPRSISSPTSSKSSPQPNLSYRRASARTLFHELEEQQELRIFLAQAGLNSDQVERCEKRLRNEEISDVDTLRLLSDADLERIGITMGLRRRIQHHFATIHFST